MSLKLDQALLTAFINGGFGLPIAHENVHYEPTAQTPYVELRVLPNPVEQLSSHSDETSGVFRCILRYPLDTGAVTAKTKAEAIMAVFPRGENITYGGQKTLVTQVQRQPGIPEEGWYKLIVDIYYRAFITRT